MVSRIPPVSPASTMFTYKASKTFGELRKVHWPTRLEVRNLSIIVLAVTVGMSLILGFFDFTFEQAFFGILKPQPDLIWVGVLIFVVLAIIVLVFFAGRERR